MLETRPAAARVRPHAARAARSWCCRADERRDAADPRRRRRGALDPDDLLITDDRGPLGLAGIMGGGSTEIATTDHRDRHRGRALRRRHDRPESRRHKLSSEASRRFERGVDPALRRRGRAARGRAAGRAGRGSAEVDAPIVGVCRSLRTIRMAASHPGDVAGRDIARRARRRAPDAVGCGVDGSGRAGGDAAVLAARPDRPGRPRRGGPAAGGLRQRSRRRCPSPRRAAASPRASGCAASSAGRWPAPGSSRC